MSRENSSSKPRGRETARKRRIEARYLFLDGISYGGDNQISLHFLVKPPSDIFFSDDQKGSLEEVPLSALEQLATFFQEYANGSLTSDRRSSTRHKR